LVHVSSTSIQFNFNDALNVREDSPSPKRFSCHYAKTKHLAEKVIRTACEQGLNSIIVRARAIFGPGDQSLMPRLLNAFDQGRLRQIGNGTNVTDLTYIDNLVYALILAFDNGASGQTVTVTGGEPVVIWKLVRRILKETGRDRPLKTVPYSIAMAVALASETKHRVLRKKQEPTLTRYAVGLLAKSQTFDTALARSELKYEPIVEQNEAINRTIDSLTRTDSGYSETCVRMRLFTTGYTPQPRHLIEQGANKNTIKVHAMFAVIDHSRFGLTLFDTGYGPRYFDATSQWPYRAYAKLTPVVTSEELKCSNVLIKAGIDPAQVKRIIISHFHADHICGLRDFPNAEIIAKQTAWDSIDGVSGLAALRRAFLPSLLPEDIKDRLFLLPSFTAPGLGPLAQCHDLFGDGSIRLFDLAGHAAGQIGALLQTGLDKRAFLLADATFTRKTIVDGLAPTIPFLALASDRKAARNTISKLQELHQRYPDIELLPTHCVEVADEYHFEQQLSEAADRSI
jgi:glyoxylase-like metal-dependent hydrolase (beta-lactamase superfamily II)